VSALTPNVLYFFLIPFSLVSIFSFPVGVLLYFFLFGWILIKNNFKIEIRREYFIINIIIFFNILFLTVSLFTAIEGGFYFFIRNFLVLFFLFIIINKKDFIASPLSISITWYLFYLIAILSIIFPEKFGFFYDSLNLSRLKLWFGPNQFALVCVFGLISILNVTYLNRYRFIISIFTFFCVIFIISKAISITGLLSLSIIFIIYFIVMLFYKKVSFIYLSLLLSSFFILISLDLFNDIEILNKITLSVDNKFESGTAYARIQSVENVINSDFPFFGNGLGAANLLETKPHNWLFLQLYEQGYIGAFGSFCLTVSVFLTIFFKGLKSRVPEETIYTLGCGFLFLMSIALFPNVTDFIGFLFAGFSLKNNSLR
jgi:hypothetical protein